MDAELEELANAADAVAADQRAVAKAARRMQHLRDQGRSWSRILADDAAAGEGLTALLRRSGRRLAELTAKWSSLVARGLSREGESRRRIAERLGVSHQRVSAILGNSETHE